MHGVKYICSPLKGMGLVEVLFVRLRWQRVTGACVCSDLSISFATDGHIDIKDFQESSCRIWVTYA